MTNQTNTAEKLDQEQPQSNEQQQAANENVVVEEVFSTDYDKFNAMKPEKLAEIYFDLPKREQRLIDRLPCWREVVWVKPVDTFGDYWSGLNNSIPKRLYRHPSCPNDVPASYHPDQELLVDTVLFATGKRHLSMGIYGDTGTGKTEMARYVADKLNIPFLSVSLTKSSREDKVTGTYLIEDGETFFDWSLIPIAYDSKGPGYMLCINEIDKGCDSVIAKLHDIADYKPFTIDDTAEEVLPHPQFRLLVTGQTSGSGDPRGLYKVEPLDRAFIARFFWVRATYPSKDIMKSILKQEFPRLLDATLDPMCTFYELCTQALENSHLDIEGEDLINVGQNESNQGEPLIFSTPTSIRLMKGWGDLLLKYEGHRNVGNVYKMCIGQSANPDDRRPMLRLLEMCFGDALEQPALIEAYVPEFPESEPQDISEVDFALFLHKEGEVNKVWMIGCDFRGTHTLYTHPVNNKTVYFHKPLSDFNDDIKQQQTYMLAKGSEKKQKGYIKQPGLFRYDIENDKLLYGTKK